MKLILWGEYIFFKCEINKKLQRIEQYVEQEQLSFDFDD